MRIGEIEIAIIDIITFTGIMITFITGVLNLCQNRKSLYINNITRFRVIWISTFRAHIASLKELSNITNLYLLTKTGANKIAYRRELDRIVSLIKMHLNFTGTYDIELMSKVDKLKSAINSYLFMYYYKNALNLVEDNQEGLNKFNEVIEGISEKQLLEEFLNIVTDKENKKSYGLLELKEKVKLVCGNNFELINKTINKSDYLINKYENEIDCLNDDIDAIVQIYLKAEWIRCKVETRIWPYNKYNEEQVIRELQTKYKNIIDAKKNKC